MAATTVIQRLLFEEYLLLASAVLSTFHAFQGRIQCLHHPREVGTIIPILQMWTLRTREVEYLS